MTLRFIIGRAGAGKTRTCLEEIATRLRQSPAGETLLFMVPEQATFQTELALCAMPGIKGVMRAQVLGFRRLAHHVLDEVGGGTKPHIGELGKQMLLRRFLDARRPQLRAFNRVSSVPGFLDTLAQSIAEFKTHLVGPETLEDAALRIHASGEQRLADKMSDLALLYSDLQEYLSDRYTDPDDYLSLLAESIPRSSLIKGGEIWIDGFSGFTPQEYAVLKALLLESKRVNVALCLDAPEARGDAPAGDVFHITRLTYQKLTQMARENGVRLEPHLELTAESLPRFAVSPALACLERSFSAHVPERFPGNPTGIALVAGAEPQAEIEAVAREIIHLCRDAGYRYREISIVTRQLELYRDLIEEVFSDYSIPFFIDCKRHVTHHPVIELIRSALDVVITGWTYDPVFRYLKTDLVPVDRESVDLLENYVLAFGIRGSQWTDDADWTFRLRRLEESSDQLSNAERDHLDLINGIRRRAIAELARFEQNIDSAGNVAGITRSLVGLLLRLDVPGRLDKWSEEAREDGDADLALQYAQLWNGLMKLFDELVEALGEEELSLPEYARVIESGLNGLRLALVPPALDQVLVSSLERSRNPNVRAAFVIGVNDGVLPARQRDDGLLSDREREWLASHGVELAPGIRQRYLEEQFLVYIGLTRSSEFLWVSYALADNEGAALNPSVVIGRLRAVFPKLREKVFAAEPGRVPGNDLHYVAHPRGVIPYLATRMRGYLRGDEIDPIWWDVYNHALTNPVTAALIKTVLESLFYHNSDPPLGPNLTLSIYGNPLRASVSRIELFNACPFAHFCHYGLRLRERRIQKLGPPDVGEFIHAALKLFVERAGLKAPDWSKLPDDACAQLAAEVVDELTPALQNEILLSTARYRHLGAKVQKTVERAALVLTEHARRGNFRPLGLEVPFGPGEAIAPPPVTLGDREMHLVGRIDRVDAAEWKGKQYFRVIDYKSGHARVDLPSIIHGLQVQLLAYLDVVLTCAPQLIGSEAEGAGMLYFRAHNPLVSAEGPLEQTLVKEKVLEKLRMNGLLVADQEVIRLMDSDTGPGHSSRLIPVSITKKGRFYASSAVLPLDRIAALRSHLRGLIRRTGKRIVDGSVEIVPSVLGRFHACRYCVFRPVCQFDPLFSGNRLRPLERYSSEEIWNRIETGEEVD